MKTNGFLAAAAFMAVAMAAPALASGDIYADQRALRLSRGDNSYSIGGSNTDPTSSMTSSGVGVPGSKPTARPQTACQGQHAQKASDATCACAKGE